MPETAGSPYIKSAHRSNALAAFSTGGGPAFSLASLASAARFSLRLRPETAGELRNVAGFLLELPINRCAATDARTCMRLGPDEWLLEDAKDESKAVARELAEALGNRFFSLVDISHRNVALAVSGARARDVINGGCPLDLHDAAFPAGHATRTLFGKAEIVLSRPAADLQYRVECWRSFAPYVHALLKDAGREFETR